MFLVVFEKHLNIEHCFTFGKSSLAILCLSFSPRRLLLCLIWPAGDLKEENIYKKKGEMGLLDLKMAQRVRFVFFVFVFGDTEDVSL